MVHLRGVIYTTPCLFFFWGVASSTCLSPRYQAILADSVFPIGEHPEKKDTDGVPRVGMSGRQSSFNKV